MKQKLSLYEFTSVIKLGISAHKQNLGTESTFIKVLHRERKFSSG